ncbi:hypothetical protein GGI21_000891 [Coemansia aciculifera]|nr:hypothetical protein GGI21_000891 [Coemansia aciculifera]
MGRSYHLIATAGSDGHVRIYKFWSDLSTAKTAISDSLFVREGDQQGNVESTDAATAKANGSRHLGADSDEDDEDADEDDSDADNRSSAGSSDSLRARPKRSGKSRRLSSTRGITKAFEPHSELVGDLIVEPLMPVRRVRWNSTGTMLVSSSDDGVARMWKMTINGTWREAAAVTAEKSS